MTYTFPCVKSVWLKITVRKEYKRLLPMQTNDYFILNFKKNILQVMKNNNKAKTITNTGIFAKILIKIFEKKKTYKKSSLFIYLLSLE